MSFIKRLFHHEQKGYDDKSLTIMHGVLSSQTGMTTSDREALENLGINREMIIDDKLTRILEAMSIQDNGKDGKSIDWNMLALRLMTSNLIRTSYIDPIDAEIAKLDAEIFIDRVEMSMDEETYELGGTNFLEACNQIIKTAYSDATKGRKAQLLKVVSRTFEIGMPPIKKEKESMMQ